MADWHLATLKRPYIEAILSGCKTVESRFMRTRRDPFGRIRAGDRLFLKVSSGPVCPAADVKRVLEFENLSPGRMRRIKAKYNSLILGSEQYWLERRESRYGVLLWLGGVKCIKPMRISKKDWRAWVVLEAGKDFGLLGKAKRRSL